MGFKKKCNDIDMIMKTGGIVLFQSTGLFCCVMMFISVSEKTLFFSSVPEPKFSIECNTKSNLRPNVLFFFIFEHH